MSRMPTHNAPKTFNRDGQLVTPTEARARRLAAEDATKATDPKTQLKCPTCRNRHSGYHATPGPWPYCLSMHCADCCKHRLANDDPKTWGEEDRRLLVRANDEAKRLRREGLL